MAFVEFFGPNTAHNSVHRPLAVILLAAIGLVGVSASVSAQTATSQPSAALPVAPASAPVAAAKLAGPQWLNLSGAQKQALLPLAGTWDTLSATHKGKWLALAKRYPTLAPAEQEKLRNRMAEWAALNPHQREQARLNFAETKRLSPSERAADWETYQALSPQERQKLGAQAPSKPAGAAVAIKPVPPEKLTPVPVTRRTPLRDHAGAAAPHPTVDRHTLLPQPPRAAASEPEPAN